ncbi:PepSY domain-containing protein [Candidatus Woesearchaeota archaeon]|nr:PepSY domain-containing protein [Candidatus Woesearchaeota archaeon]
MKEILEKLEQSTAFKEWRKGHAQDYLTSFFTMDPEQGWQLSYYDKNKDTITSFEMAGESVKRNEISEVYKESGSLEPIDMKNVKISLDDAWRKALKLRARLYPNDLMQKKITILQNAGDMQVWNLTIISSAFRTINIRIDAATGEIIMHKASSIFGYGKDI